MLGAEWARIHFIENEGMAFGLKFGGNTGKLLLSLFRLIMIGFLIYLVRGMIKEKVSIGLLVCFSLIIAGAMGNMIDSAFYGLIFSESTFHPPVAEIFPEGGGYAGFLYGHVVDMLHFPMFESTWPEWVPRVGGNRFEFFSPVFNLADAAISTGVISILIFHRKFFSSKKSEPTPLSTAQSEVKLEPDDGPIS